MRCRRSSFPSHPISRFSQDGSSQQKEEWSSSLRGIREDGTGNSRRTIDGPDEVYDGGINLFKVKKKPEHFCNNQFGQKLPTLPHLIGDALQLQAVPSRKTF